jgi:predicted nuclease with TOPRIM domain
MVEIMTEEIKEILDRLDFNEWEVDLYKVPITWSELYDIRDYITNLQKENEELKAELHEANDSSEWWHNRFNAIQKENEYYKSRNEKAVEYIKENSDMVDWLHCVNYDLLNILEGGDEE